MINVCLYIVIRLIHVGGENLFAIQKMFSEI